jgi:hypothetical protein
MQHISAYLQWSLTTVYGPAREEDKDAFLQELIELHRVHLGPWLIEGDFNMIYRAQDNNNTRLDKHCMGQFWRFLNEVSLKELHLKGCLFTWSNERLHPTLEHIDRAFITSEWEGLYPHCGLHSLASMCSDRAPLILHTDNLFRYYKRFHSIAL